MLKVTQQINKRLAVLDVVKFEPKVEYWIAHMLAVLYLILTYFLLIKIWER